jgi:hypothetical protein
MSIETRISGTRFRFGGKHTEYFAIRGSLIAWNARCTKYVHACAYEYHKAHLCHSKEENMGRGIMLWLLGVPIPIIILLALFWH